MFTSSEKEVQELILPVKGSLNGEDEALKKLRRFVKKGIELLGDYFLEYHDNPAVTPEKDLNWNVGVPIHGDVRVPDPFRIEWRPGWRCACVYFEGNPGKFPSRSGSPIR